MALSKTGLLISFDQDEHSRLIRKRGDQQGYQTTSDGLWIRDQHIHRANVALLSFSHSTLDYVALATKGKEILTAKSRIEFSFITNLEAISIRSLESKGVQVKPHFMTMGGGAKAHIPPEDWVALIHAVKKERPLLAADIDRLVALSDYSDYTLTGPSAQIFLQEREALGIALDIFSGDNKLREDILTGWIPGKNSISDRDETYSTATLKPTSAEASFLDGIPKRFQEESALQYDLFSWKGMTPRHRIGGSVFRHGDRRLDVIYANRNSLEHTLGVDLIYYNVSYNLFALVQYKLMHKEGNGMVYRPDKQLVRELARMDKVCAPRPKATMIQSHMEVRLNRDGFMFKLVPDQGLRPASGELIKGMYVLREYMRFLIGRDGPKGTRGGSMITFENAPRYLTNSQFSEGVNAGWIGTDGSQSAKLRQVIKTYYETGRALIVAHESPNEKSIKRPRKTNNVQEQPRIEEEQPPIDQLSLFS